MIYHIKSSVTNEMLEKLGFSKNRHGEFYRLAGKGEIVIRTNGVIDKLMFDSSTYTGYKYASEYRHDVKRHIKDLIELDYIKEQVNAKIL